ncbi:MAG: hypothetical protein LBP37_05525 [Spirochaetaceae bacterium]|jgi:hypothetical protein|nr:hypothetical protein [Spirochaetaceae bacterium]
MKETNTPDVLPVDDSKLTERDIVFYYSREHRLKKASARVRDLYENTPKRRFGIFSVLVDTKAKAMLFIVIVAVCLLLLLMPLAAK